jgi:hypothetical protein
MRLYFQGDPVPHRELFRRHVEDVLDRIAQTTDTRDLVVAVYAGPGQRWHGELTSTQLLSRQDFSRQSRSWPSIAKQGTPEGLPEQFFLVRLSLDVAGRSRTESVYGWRIRFGGLLDHVAYLFAHELHHFRRYGLWLHPGEGERSACRWGVRRAKEAGFAVDGHPVRTRRTREPAALRLSVGSNKPLLRRIQIRASRLAPSDLTSLAQWVQRRLAALADQTRRKQWAEHFEALRSLPVGAPVLITSNLGGQRYAGQVATKLRTLKRGSHRMAIRTSDGRKWRWAMRFLVRQR